LVSVGLHENEEVYDAVVESRCFGAYRRSSKPNVHVTGADRFRLFNINNTSGLGRKLDGRH